jgi:tRNA A37 threonylcarbamoyladenosine modification protein TsaB
VVVSSERRGDAFYLGYYWRGANGVEPLMDDAAVNGPLPDLFPVAEPVVVLGPIADDPQLMAAVGPRAQPGQAILSGAQVAWAAWPGVQWGQSQDPLTLAPLYLRPPTASNPSR